ncbi:hypothetical protein HETIRDRAFT_311728 [Heterobasidion irregulare TC 32-1]|uniref:Uncharacterized protein n=1 Tax=Heterobasidion irregulare (strain TC 32-1) TaxID=747525 RepID=W4KHE4_HETIT|nr:uncharacterized protein HETIRDRAFT_311728 [Heterobasidion irregulare TC 32-1]ETW84745.1 hypothetical protein HETIRDRAFT_311728 [Heterobasidion irregulare TC 32-1]
MQTGTAYGSTSQRPRTDHAGPQNAPAPPVYSPYRSPTTDNSRVQSTYLVPAQARPGPPTNYWSSRVQRTYTDPTYTPPLPSTTARATVPAHGDAAPPALLSHTVPQVTFHDLEEVLQIRIPESVSVGGGGNRRDFNATQRAPAERAYGRMRKAQAERQRARSRGDRPEVTRLKALVEEEKATAERLNMAAAECIFKGEYDLPMSSARACSNSLLFHLCCDGGRMQQGAYDAGAGSLSMLCD